MISEADEKINNGDNPIKRFCDIYQANKKDNFSPLHIYQLK